MAIEEIRSMEGSSPAPLIPAAAASRWRDFGICETVQVQVKGNRPRGSGKLEDPARVERENGSPRYRARYRDLGFGLILLCATLIVYWPALGGSALWDDDAHLTKPAL